MRYNLGVVVFVDFVWVSCIYTSVCICVCLFINLKVFMFVCMYIYFCLHVYILFAGLRLHDCIFMYMSMKDNAYIYLYNIVRISLFLCLYIPKFMLALRVCTVFLSKCMFYIYTSTILFLSVVSIYLSIFIYLLRT